MKELEAEVTSLRSQFSSMEDEARFEQQRTDLRAAHGMIAGLEYAVAVALGASASRDGGPCRCGACGIGRSALTPEVRAIAESVRHPAIAQEKRYEPSQDPDANEVEGGPQCQVS